MALNPKTIYIAQRTDDGSAWREVYISGSNLVLQTDVGGYLTGSDVLPASITILSASYASSAEMSVSASWSISSSFSDTSFSSSYSKTASYTERSNSASYANYSSTASVSISASVAISASRSVSSNFSTYAVTASYVFSSEESSRSTTASYALTASYLLGQSDTASYSINAGTASYAVTASYLLGQSPTSSYALSAGLIDNTGNTGSGYLVGIPVDGYYGPGTTGSIANIQSGDRVEDALDKVENILFKLSPARPPNLSTKSLLLTGAYTANLQGTNTTISSRVTNNQTPTFQLVGGMVVGNAFSDGDQGQLSASIDGTSVGSRLLTPASDVGTYDALQITSDADYYAGQAGKAGFWNALLAQIVTTTPITDVGPHTAQLQHTQTGNTPAFTFYIDDPITPSGVIGSVSASGVVYVSGVPALTAGSTITLEATASNTVGRFYNSTHIFRGSGIGISAGDYSLPSSPLSESIQSSVRSFTVNGGSQTENASFTVTAYNSIGGSSAYTITNTGIRMDSALDPANRVRSGIGHYPISGSGFGDFGIPFQPSESLVSTNEELQLLNGQYRYPTGNYTSAVPVAGPDYTIVNVGVYNNFRWVTLNMGSITNKANIRIDFSNTFGFGAVILSNFSLQVCVNGSTPTAGWVDGNAAYSGTGNPTNNGDAALAVANSTTTSKLVTFGASVKTGVVFVRIGIPAGDTKRFGGITITASI